MYLYSFKNPQTNFYCTVFCSVKENSRISVSIFDKWKYIWASNYYCFCYVCILFNKPGDVAYHVVKYIVLALKGYRALMIKIWAEKWSMFSGFNNEWLIYSICNLCFLSKNMHTNIYPYCGKNHSDRGWPHSS